MLSDAWVDPILIMAASGLFAFLLALGVVRNCRAFTDRNSQRPPSGRRRLR
jgi:hypothetical protein